MVYNPKLDQQVMPPIWRVDGADQPIVPIKVERTIDEFSADMQDVQPAKQNEQHILAIVEVDASRLSTLTCIDGPCKGKSVKIDWIGLYAATEGCIYRREGNSLVYDIERTKKWNEGSW